MKQLAWVIIAVLVFSGLVQGAAVPPLINYQGEVKNDAGVPLSTGFYDIDFRIYNTASAAEGGTLLWSRRYNLYVLNGMFNTILGQGGNAIAGDNPAYVDLMQAFASYNGDQGDPRYLSLAVSGGAEFTPRQRLLSAPYAVRAETAYYADTALNASNAATATHASEADHAANADQATVATTATQAGNADKLDNQDSSYFARQDQMAVAPAGNWRAQFWDGTHFHNGPLYWHEPVLGVGGQPGNDANTGLRMMKGSLRPLFGEGWDKGIIFQRDSSDANAHALFQTESGNGKELHLKSQGSGPSYVTVQANNGVTLQGGSDVTIQAGSKVTMQTPSIVSSALKEGVQIKWANIANPSVPNEEQTFTAEGDGLFILNAGQCEWMMTMPEHADQPGNTATRSFVLKFCHNGVDQTLGHSFVFPVRKGMQIKSRTRAMWNDAWWQCWVIYFN